MWDRSRVQPRPAGRDEHDLALTRGDQRRGLENGRDSEHVRSPRAWSEPELEHGLLGELADDAVDLRGRDAGVGECAECTF